MNIKLTIQYDGTAYHGWQVQAEDITIESELTKALERITGEQVKLTGCGRTDSGVHAMNYVCNFHTNAKIPVERYPYALNTYLPTDIVCKSAQTADDDFNANRSAISKRYIYKIYNSDIPDAFMGRYSWQYKYALDVEKMCEAAKAFIGEHDFSSFCSNKHMKKSKVRRITDINIMKEKDKIPEEDLVK